MNPYIQTGYMQIELNMLFQECSIRYETVQNVALRQPITFLAFHRFMNLYEYDCVNLPDFASRFCGYIFMPESSKLSDQQKLANDSFAMNLMTSELIMAETIDEKADYIYLIGHKSIITPYGNMMPMSYFNIFQIKYEELWGVSSTTISLIKTLHLNNMLVTKHLHDQKSNALIYKQYLSNWSLVQASKEFMCEKLTQELKNKRKTQQEVEKPENVQPEICIMCYRSPKNVVFLPCGHIAICKDCAIGSMEIELCKIFYKKSNSKLCLVCKESIKEAREIFI